VISFRSTCFEASLGAQKRALAISPIKIEVRALSWRRQRIILHDCGNLKKSNNFTQASMAWQPCEKNVDRLRQINSPVVMLSWHQKTDKGGSGWNVR
jgi:hypothetical protein